MNYGEENLNDLYLLIYKISDHMQRPIKILIFFADLPVYLSDRHSGGKYLYSIAVSVYVSDTYKQYRLQIRS